MGNENANKEKKRFDAFAKAVVKSYPFLKDVLREFVKEVANYTDEELFELLKNATTLNVELFHNGLERRMDVGMMLHTRSGDVIIHIENQLHLEKDIYHRICEYRSILELDYFMNKAKDYPIYNFWYIMKPPASLQGDVITYGEKMIFNAYNGKGTDVPWNWLGNSTTLIFLYDVTNPNKLNDILACKEDYLYNLNIIFADYLSSEEKKRRLKLRGIELSSEEEEELKMSGLYEGVLNHGITIGEAKGEAKERNRILKLIDLINEGKSNNEIKAELHGVEDQYIEEIRNKLK